MFVTKKNYKKFIDRALSSIVGNSNYSLKKNHYKKIKKIKKKYLTEIPMQN